MQAYSFPITKIAKALVYAKKRGVCSRGHRFEYGLKLEPPGKDPPCVDSSGEAYGTAWEKRGVSTASPGTSTGIGNLQADVAVIDRMEKLRLEKP